VGRLAEISERSRLNADAGEVWERIASLEGINYELRPLLRMTAPAELTSLDPGEIPVGTCIGRSWILLFGVLPFDYDDLTLVRLEPGRGFLERSRMLTQRLWEHERTLEPHPPGTCTLTDRVRFEPRLGLPGRPVAPVVQAIFRHRHRRLRRFFGGEPA
jgi:hypothetical protein